MLNSDLVVVLLLVIDSFIIISLNNDSLETNIRNYFGIETCFAIVGFLIGSLIFSYINKTYFYYVVALLIVIVQIIDLKKIELPSFITPVLLGIDSLFVFMLMPWYAIPFLTIMELIAIVSATYIGKKFVSKLPYTDYMGNVIMIIIAIKLVMEAV